MDKDILKDKELDEELDELLTEETEEAEQLDDEEAFQSLKLEDLNLFLSDEEILSLNEEERVMYRQAIEIAIEKYDDVFMERGEEIYTVEEVKLLKQIEKKLYKTSKLVEKKENAKGFFEHIKLWMGIYGIVMVLLNIFPVSPFLPVLIYERLYIELPEFFQSIKGFDIYMIIYSLIMIVPGFIIWLRLKKDTKEKIYSKRIFFGISCIIAALAIIGFVIYLIWVK